MDWFLGIEALSIYRNGECLNQNTRMGMGLTSDDRYGSKWKKPRNGWIATKATGDRCCDWSWAIPSSLHLSMLRKPFCWGKNLEKKCFTVPVQVHWNLLRSCSGGEAFVFPTSNLLCGTWSGSPPTAAIPSRCELLNYQRAIHSNHIPLAGVIPQCWSAPAICQKDISMRFLYPQDPIDMSMICPKNLHEMSAFRRVENRIGLPCGSIIQDPSRGGWKPRGLRRRFRGDFPMIPSYSTDGWAVDVVTSQLGFDLPGDTTRVTLDWRFVMINQRVNVTNWKIGMFERKIIILINLQIGHVPELC
jgi:hypothetical protein